MESLGSLDLKAVFSGSEPSIEQKRKAKNYAWSNGARPKETRHRIFLGDARKIMTSLKEDIHLVVTSPPYFNLVRYEDNPGQLGNCEDYFEFLDGLDEVWRTCFERLVPGGRMCVVVGDVCVPRRRNGRHHVIPLHADIIVRCRQIGFDYLTPILWAKITNMTTEVGGSARFLGKPYEPNGIIKNDVEYILMLRKPGPYRKPTVEQRALSILDATDHDRGYRSFWTDIRGECRKTTHPAPYPVELAERLIGLFSFVGDTVLDPFCGTGTTTVAAINAARSSIGCDIEPQYIQLAKERIDVLKPAIPVVMEYSGL